MATVNGTVTAVSTKWDKYSVQIDGAAWYGTKIEWAKVKPENGDVIEFDDGGGKFTKNIKILTAGDRSTTALPSAGGKKWTPNNLGVELGHASNLAMTVTLAVNDLPPGSPAFYKFWMTQTETVYKVMKGLRAKYEAGDVAVDIPEGASFEPKVAVPIKPKAEVTEEDLFA
jgi:hypothetical protein